MDRALVAVDVARSAHNRVVALRASIAAQLPVLVDRASVLEAAAADQAICDALGELRGLSENPSGTADDLSATRKELAHCQSSLAAADRRMAAACAAVAAATLEEKSATSALAASLLPALEERVRHAWKLFCREQRAWSEVADAASSESWCGHSALQHGPPDDPSTLACIAAKERIVMSTLAPARPVYPFNADELRELAASLSPDL
jgi:hypothetical protein